MEHPTEFDTAATRPGPVDTMPESAVPSRMPYVTPGLAVYGPVIELTRTVGSRGKHDRFLSRSRTGF